MNLGKHLRELSRLRVGCTVCVLLATFAALSVSYKVSLLPPGLERRSLQMAAASTQALVDTPTSVVLDLRRDTNDLQPLTDRAVLLGNLMASAPVRQYIGRRAGVPGDVIRAATPRTPNAPRPFETPDTKKKAADLLASTDQYRLTIEVNPTVPVLTIYAQASTAKAAAALANAAVDGVRDYLIEIARRQGIESTEQVRVEQLGRARGQVINAGVNVQATALAFVFFLAASSAAAIFIARVRRGFKLAAEQEQLDAALLGALDAEAEDHSAPRSFANERDVVAR